MAGIGSYEKGKAFTLKSGNKPSFKNVGSSLKVGEGQGSKRKGKYTVDPDAPGYKYGPGYEPPVSEEDKNSPAKHPHTRRRAHGTYGHNTDTGKSVAEGGKARPDNPNYVPPKKKSPAKTHKPGHKKGTSVSDFDDTVAYAKKKEGLLDQGFTPKDADAMIKSGAATGKAGVESYEDRMKRLSKKYKKTPKEINKILKSKEYTGGRAKTHRTK